MGLVHEVQICSYKHFLSSKQKKDPIFILAKVSYSNASILVKHSCAILDVRGPIEISLDWIYRTPLQIIVNKKYDFVIKDFNF